MRLVIVVHVNMVYAEPKRANRPTFSQPRPLSVPSNCAEAATAPSTRLPAAIAATNRSASERSSGRLMTQRADATRRAKTPKARRPRVPASSVAVPYICSNWLGSTKNPVPNPTRTTEWTANRGWRLTYRTLSYEQPRERFSEVQDAGSEPQSEATRWPADPPKSALPLSALDSNARALSGMVIDDTL